MADSDKLGSPQFDTAQPDGNSDPRQGDDKIRDVKQRLYNWATREHNVDGKHKIPVTPALVPDATATGQLAIKTSDEELYANISGSAFVKMTSKGEVVALQADVAALEADVVTLGGTDGSLQTQINDLSAEIDALAPTAITAQTPVVYTASGTFNDPTATFILVECWRGGGSAQSPPGSTLYGSSGGGGGAYAAAFMVGIGLGSVPVTVAPPATVGNDGTSSSFGTYVVAGGGLKGTWSETLGLPGGAGGAASFGVFAKGLSQVGVSGGNGGQSNYNTGGGGGGCAGDAGTNGTYDTPVDAPGGAGAYEGGSGGAGGSAGTAERLGVIGGTPGGGTGGAGGRVTTVGGAPGRVRITVYK